MLYIDDKSTWKGKNKEENNGVDFLKITDYSFYDIFMGVDWIKIFIIEIQLFVFWIFLQTPFLWILDSLRILFQKCIKIKFFMVLIGP